MISFFKLIFLNNLLIWYRETYTEDVEDVITPLDELINEVADKIETW